MDPIPKSRSGRFKIFYFDIGLDSIKGGSWALAEVGAIHVKKIVYFLLKN